MMGLTLTFDVPPPPSVRVGSAISPVVRLRMGGATMPPQPPSAIMYLVDGAGYIQEGGLSGQYMATGMEDYSLPTDMQFSFGSCSIQKCGNFRLRVVLMQMGASNASVPSQIESAMIDVHG